MIQIGCLGSGCCTGCYWSYDKELKQKRGVCCSKGAIADHLASSNSYILARNSYSDTVLTDCWESKVPNPYKFTKETGRLVVYNTTF